VVFIHHFKKILTGHLKIGAHLPDDPFFEQGDDGLYFSIIH